MSYLGLLPALQMKTTAQQEPLQRNLLMIAAHVIWGATLGVTEERSFSEIIGPMKYSVRQVWPIIVRKIRFIKLETIKDSAANKVWHNHWLMEGHVSFVIGYDKPIQ